MESNAMFRPLKASEIEVKVKQVSEKGAVALLYKTARTDMQLLDETIGALNWETDYKVIKDNLYCGIGIHDNNTNRTTWKWDCGTESREDGEGNEKKGEASDAFKRAGFKWGIGRELYTAPFIFLNVETVKDGTKYRLKDKFTTFEVKSISYSDGTITGVTITNNRGEIVYQTGKPTPISKTDKPENAPTESPASQKPKSKYGQLKELVESKGGNFTKTLNYCQKKYGTDRINELSDDDFEGLLKEILYAT